MVILNEYRPFLALDDSRHFRVFHDLIIIRPFIDENLLLEILFPEIRFLVPFLLLSAFWIFIAVAVTITLNKK